MLRFFDTLSGELRALVPRRQGTVSIYACGPTVYDAPHVGHARTALTYDVLRRYLEWRGLQVTVVSNVTDIDDKIIERAAQEGTTEPELAARFAQVYADEMTAFGISPPDHRPQATQFVPQMIAVIAELIERGAAYVIEGAGVYFDVSAYPEYGALVHREADELREGAGARVEVDERKDDPLDFALWKAAKPGEPTWGSPWGPGRPGWHIECVAMALELLGDGFDIHGGGTDLVFPHHENERSEAEAAGHPFARHWIHSAMLNIGGEKMSKSLGNFETLGGALAAFGARPLRLAFLQAHYRSVVELGDEALAGAAGGIDRIDALARRLRSAGIELDGANGHLDEALLERFNAAMDNDLGTPEALAVAFEAISMANVALDSGGVAAAAAFGRTASTLLGVLGIEAAPASTFDAGIDALVEQREAARRAKDYAEADRLRAELRTLGYEVEDTPHGPLARRI